MLLKQQTAFSESDRLFAGGRKIMSEAKDASKQIIMAEAQDNFDNIIEQLKQDPRNAEYTEQGIPPVFQIHPKAHILIIGQAPGRKVQESHIPFADKSGDTLIDWMGILRETFYSDEVSIMPMDFYYPGRGKSGDKPPRDFIAKEYHKALLDLMPDIRLTLLIGKYALGYYLGNRMQRNLTETVRHYEDYLPEIFPIVHPSPLNFRWQAKNPWFLEEVVPRLREEVQRAMKE